MAALVPEHYLAFLGLSLVLAFTPGPDVLYVLTRSLSQGTRAGLVAAAGFALGNIFHTLAVASGVGALLAARPDLLATVRYVGALYLIYVGVVMIKRAAPITAASATGSDARVFSQSILANLLNPKVILFFLSLFPQFVDAPEHSFAQTCLLGASFIAVTLLAFGSVALLAGRLNAYLSTDETRQVRLQQVGGAALLLIAVWLAWP